MAAPSYLSSFDGQSAGPNYRPRLIEGDERRGYSFSTAGVPIGQNFSPKADIYDGFEAFAESRCGDETAAWMKASMLPQGHHHSTREMREIKSCCVRQSL